MHISCKCRGGDVLRLATRSFFISFHSRQDVLHFMSLCRSPDVIPSTTSTAPPLGARLADVTSTSTTSTTKSSCGRFQFQCQTSKECIAVRKSTWQHDWWRGKLNSFVFPQIYNVCDQIAQCDDGSDEGPEVRPPKSWRRKPKEFPATFRFIKLFSDFSSVPHQTSLHPNPWWRGSKFNRSRTFRATRIESPCRWM